MNNFNELLMGFMDKCTQHYFMSYHMETTLQGNKKQLEKSPNLHLNFQGVLLLANDIQKSNDNTIPIKAHSLKGSDLVSHFDNLSNEFHIFLYIKIYEAFASFFSEINFLHFAYKNNIDFTKAKLIRTKYNLKYPGSKKGRYNNMYLIHYLTDMCSYFRNNEKSTTLIYPLSDIFEVIGKVRSCIVHDESLYKKDKYNALSKSQRDILHQYFIITDITTSKMKNINLTSKLYYTLLGDIASFSLFIHKSVLLDCGMNYENPFLNKES